MVDTYKNSKLKGEIIMNKYCAHCSAVLLDETIEGRHILACPLCGHIYEEANDKYRCIGVLNGGKAVKELINNLQTISSFTEKQGD